MLKLSKLKNRKGITIVEVMIVLGIIGLLCAMALPNFGRMRANAYRDQCITNLRTIAAAKERWSLETGAADTDEPSSSDLDPYIKDGTASLVCPLDPSSSFSTSYTINDIETNPACNINGAHVLP